MRYTKTHLTFICCILLCFLSCYTGHAEGDFLRTKGHDMVDADGNKVLLRGVGLGNWLLPEGYMWKFGEDGDRPRKIEKIAEDLIGKEAADQFWIEFRKHYITEADIRRIAELGFNSVRPALNARLFLTEGENPEYVEKTRKFLDRYAQAMQGNSAAFGSRLDRGWVPPTLEDVEAETGKCESEASGKNAS